MSFFSYSKAATLNKVMHAELRRELLVTHHPCEYPYCQTLAVSVAESGVAAFLCQIHIDVWNSSKQARRVIEQAIIAFLLEETVRTQAAAFEDPGEVIFYDGSKNLSDQILDGANSVVNDFIKREIMPVVFPIKVQTESDLPKNPTLSTLGVTNDNTLMGQFFL